MINLLRTSAAASGRGFGGQTPFLPLVKSEPEARLPALRRGTAPAATPRVADLPPPRTTMTRPKLLAPIATRLLRRALAYFEDQPVLAEAATDPSAREAGDRIAARPGAAGTTVVRGPCGSAAAQCRCGMGDPVSLSRAWA